ncbi:prolyl 3-hydroxylase 1 [Astyanax mexicanus]|uniref:prolyl 3-hydroxylase 1 n=1 Tax=Astyanax mexicanus TaxID=7994 RepID=UPI0020CB489D|nr:prolyl 3-hydroxylase 1 [Astyanax mexicanus]
MWASVLLSTLAVSVLDCSSGSVQFNGVLEPYDLLFDNAVEAYYRQDWLSVILNMERALRNKGMIRKVRTECRLACANHTGFGEPVPGVAAPPVPGAGSLEDLGFFQKVLKRAECVSACEAEKLGPPSLHKVSEAVELEFKKRTPYNYLQVAYFKINKLDKAVAAANTFYIANPDHVEMRQNLEYYSLMAGVQEADFKDLEARPHMAEFLAGKKLYSAESFSPAIDHFEAAVDEYFTADAECRVLCEGAYDYDGYNYMEYKADLFQSITDHYLHILNCKQNCAVELASTAGMDKPIEDFLPAHFNYLQFSYYNSEKYEKAIESAKTYLLFHPEDEVMKQNLAYYSAVLGEEKAADISAMEVVEQYIKKSVLEKELLYFGYEIFGITFVDPDTWTPAEVMPKKLRDKQKADRETAARITEEIGNLMKEIETLVEEKTKESTDIPKIINDGPNIESPLPADKPVADAVTVTMTSAALNGSQRVVLDGVVTDDECRELHRLSNVAAQSGDAYRGQTNPHSPSEMFQGITVLKTLKLGQEGLLPVKSARLFFDLSEKVRKVVESHFSLETPLYFSHSHLLCRSANEEKQEDPSHPVHADNCLLISELNECIKETSTYTHQDYSAILYLNDDFEGGDFIFTELDAETVTAVVRPQCGRVVAFGGSKENLHGVRAVTKGQRCAVVLWFTLDPKHNEKERIEAEELLKVLSNPLDKDFQPTEKDKSEPQNTEQDKTETPVQEQPSKASDEQTDTAADTKTDNKDVKKDAQPKAKSANKTKDKSVDKKEKSVDKKTVKVAKTATQTKAKPSGKTKEADKTKAKTAEKTKAKTADKTKEKSVDKKTVKVVSKKTGGTESKKPKAKTSTQKDSKSNSQQDKDKDEL